MRGAEELGAGGGAPRVSPWLEAGKALRAVVGDVRARDFLERAVGLGRVPDQLRGVAEDLVQIGAVRRHPAVARAAADGVVERAEGAVALHFRACGIARDLEPVAVELEGAEVAV